jgi:hypothetical protein
MIPEKARRMPYDLLVAGGHVVHPTAGTDGPADIAIGGGVATGRIVVSLEPFTYARIETVNLG